MMQFPSINPVAFSVGPLTVHWYGIMYLVGFLGAWLLLNWRIKKNNKGKAEPNLPFSGTHPPEGPLPFEVKNGSASMKTWSNLSSSGTHPPEGPLPFEVKNGSLKMNTWTAENVSDIIFYGALGVILGGRIGYVLFYNFAEFIQAPWTILQIWKGGMSFHGGLIGVILAMVLYSRKIRRHPADLTDFIAPVVPIGLGAGRIGNFINGELWGRTTDVPWGMIYPSGGVLPRHPSELYEFLLEGALFFIVLWWFSAKPRPRYAVSGLFLLCYGVFRFFVEFFREPDEQLGYVLFHWMSMGQLLCVPMIVIGVGMIIYAYKSRIKP